MRSAIGRAQEWRGDTLPHDFPPWSTVFKRYQKWTREGVLIAVHDQLRDAVRVASGRDPKPTAASVDSQSVKSTDVGGPHGLDGEKRVNGRKRHILVDVLGLLLAVVITPADIQDRDIGAVLVRRAHREFGTIRTVWVDGIYNGEVIERAAAETGINIETVKRTDDQKGFKILPKRWVVERTFGWLGRYRLLSKEYERTLESSTADVLHAMTMLMLRRLVTSHIVHQERR